MVQARDPSAIFWNPALLTSSWGRAMLISINEPFGFDFVGLSQFIPLYGTVGVALSRVSTAGETVDKGTLAWGKRFASKLAIGANVNIEKFGDDWFVDGTAGLFIGNPKVGSLGYR
ncbi:hypothetical protein GWN42_29565, partial [candidate division KSB1 bacterium]|nr:hypothetical protein [candidate division KSB1 bacterium]